MSEGADLDLGRLEFRFAKRMPATPHFYVIRSRANEADYVQLFHVIQEKGVNERFGSRNYRYWTHDGWKYWAMTSDVTKSFVINRALVEAKRERTASPGLARLRASPKAEAIRESVIADNAAAVAEIAVSHPAVDCAPKAPAPMMLALAYPEPRQGMRTDLLTTSSKIEEVPKSRLSEAAKPAALSAGAEQLLNALFKVAADGEWIDQRAIPHGMSNGKSVAAFLGGLYKRGLVDLRGDGGNRFSARVTAAGAALMAEPAP